MMLFKSKTKVIHKREVPGMFNFRIIKGNDGNDIIDRNLLTPYDSLTPVQMMEYQQVYESKCMQDNNVLVIEPSILDILKGKLRKALA